LEEICDLLNINFFNDLARINLNDENMPNILSVDQERVLSEKPKLLVFFYLLLNGLEPDSIIKGYKITGIMTVFIFWTHTISRGIGMGNPKALT
jgi:hypothetical protein